MSAKVTTTGSGKIVADSLISFSYSEDATPIDPLSTDGGSSQLTFSAVADETSTDSVLKTNSRLLINNNITFYDSDMGYFEAQVKKVDINSGGVVSITADSILAKLNVEKTAEPVIGTLTGALEYYCGLCDIEPVVDTALDAIGVNFIAWKGNVWNNLKLLTSSISASTIDRTPIEMYFNGATICFRAMPGTEFDMESTIADINSSIDSFDSGKTIDIYNYNTSYVEDAVIYDIANYDEKIDPAKAFLSSFSDSMSVNAGEKTTKVFTVDTSLTSIVQPVCVATINPYPYDPSNTSTDLNQVDYQYVFGSPWAYLYLYVADADIFIDKEVVRLSATFSGAFAAYNSWQETVTKISSNYYMMAVPPVSPTSQTIGISNGTAKRIRTGQYVIVGRDGLPVQPEEWVAQGGSLTFAKTENINEIEVTVQGPTYNGLPRATDESKTVFGPYRIGVETSGDDVDYPAIYLVGTGVKYNKKKITLATGADSLVTEKEDSKSIDNIFITTPFTAANAGLAAAQASCGPNFVMTGTSAPEGFRFGETINKTFTRDSARMRLSSIGFSDSSISWTAQRYTTFNDFSYVAGGAAITFEEFNEKAGGETPLLFNEFSLIPLMKGI